MNSVRTGRRTRKLLAIALCVGVAFGIGGEALGAVPAEAAVSSDFNPSQIISDTQFYDGNAMSSGQVQTFLNQRLAATADGKCTIGATGRKAGTAWGSTKVASKCLTTATFRSQSRTANAFCKAYAGSASESAASIIAKVGRACGISQKTLLVMLEKEQSLVTDTWPTVRQFDRAMGYACPDSGPNNSAQCDPSQTGFAQQVYRAAWQLKVYRAYPERYNYLPFTTNTILWHPSASCGTSQVYISNYATAALYIYTPYRPNQAALNAGWGTGNSCSSYGNRNFHNFWKTWFGTTQGESVAFTKVRDLYRSRPGYGAPLTTAPEKVTQNGGGAQWRFERGIITYSNASKQVYGVSTASSFTTAYLEANGAKGRWGFLTTAGPTGTVQAGNRIQKFQNGTVVFPNSTIGMQFVPTRMHTSWNTLQRQNGKLGFPIAAAAMQKDGSGVQRFQRAWLMVSGKRSAIVTQPQLSRWRALGGHPRLGYFLGSEVSVGKQSYRYTEKGLLFFTSATSQIFMGNGTFLTAYDKAGGPKGSWGVPVSKRTTHSDGSVRMTFSKGVAKQARGSGVVFIPNTKARAETNSVRPPTPTTEPTEAPEPTTVPPTEPALPETPTDPAPEEPTPTPEEPTPGTDEPEPGTDDPTEPLPEPSSPAPAAESSAAPAVFAPRTGSSFTVVTLTLRGVR